MQVGINPVGETWRKELWQAIKEGNVTNQGVKFNKDPDPILWENLRFRSTPEMKIAEALDRAGVFFLPNCRGRLNEDQKRVNKEPDFIVCDAGKWGILEVDGGLSHRRGGLQKITVGIVCLRRTEST